MAKFRLVDAKCYGKEIPDILKDNKGEIFSTEDRAKFGNGLELRFENGSSYTTKGIESLTKNYKSETICMTTKDVILYLEFLGI